MRKLLITMMVLLSFVVSAHAAEQKISHVVIIWLNDAVSSEQVTEIIKQTSVLSTINVVKNLKVGKPVPSEKKAVDDSFSFAISMDFESNEALQQYMKDDTHHKYVETVLKPVLKKVVIYDYK